MMMTIGEPHPPNQWWDFEAPPAHITHNIYANGQPHTCQHESALSALLRYLPSNKDDVFEGADEDSDDFEVPLDTSSCDNFRMFEFKVRKCVHARSHDWTECPFAHPGEKVRRRDPRKCHYSGIPCPDFRKGACKRGDVCEYAHGVFECWLHPARYRTQPCKDGTRCRRRVCFFAHTPEQLRIMPHATSLDASSSVLTGDSFVALGLFGSSPKPGSYSPPVSPKTLSPPLAGGGLMSINSVDQLAESMRRRLQVNNMKMGFGLGMSPPSRGAEFGSLRGHKMTRPVFSSLPSTSVRSRAFRHASVGTIDIWKTSCQEEQLMEYPQYRVGLVEFPDMDLDVGWVSEFIE